MGRRGRQRSKRPESVAGRHTPETVRMARVRVDDETWATFRALLGARSISEALGDLVAQEVRRHQSRWLQEQAVEPRELLDAIDRARTQQADLDVLVRRLEALAHSGLSGGYPSYPPGGTGS